MERLNSPGGGSFLLSDTPKGSPELVSPVRPTRSVRTIVESITDEQDFTLRNVHNLDSPESCPSISVATDNSTRAIKSPGTARKDSTGMPGYMSSSKATVTERQDERAPYSPFIPDFLRFTGESQGHEGAPTSFFEDSDSDLDQDAMVTEAQRGHVDRPQVVQHRSSRGANLGNSLQLPTTIRDLDDRLGPSRSKAQKILGTQVDKSRDRGFANNRRLGRIREAPAASFQEFDQSAIETERSNDPAGLGLWLHSERDSLTSTPLHRSSHVPSRRRVNFPPSPIDVKPDHRFLRQSIISTPYPHPKLTPDYGLSVSSATVRDAVITLCLYSNNNPGPKLSRIVIPADRVSGLVTDSFEKKRHDSRKDFDDEKLFQLIRDEYAKMRSPFHRYGSFRGLRSFTFSSYKDLAPPASRWQRLAHTKNFSVVDEGFDPESMLSLYRRPRAGKGQHLWVDWALSLPGRLNGGRSPSPGENLVMEYVEGWCVAKIAAAVVSVVVLSIVATLLWVMVGAGGQQRPTNASMGWRDAGGRVETGVVLGAFVLLLGWTAVGAWAALSWLVM